MSLLLVTSAFAHADPTPHVHGVDPVAVAVLAGWVLAAALLWRRVGRLA